MDTLEKKDNFIFLLEITDGYSFRNLIEYLKSTNTGGHFIFSREGISYQQSESNNFLLNDVVLYGKSMLRYKFDSEHELPLGISFPEFRIMIAKVQPKEGFRWYKKTDDENMSHCNIISTSDRSNRISSSFIRDVEIPICNYTYISYKRNLDNPNVQCYLSEFVKICKNLSSYKTDFIMIKGYNHSALFSAIREGKVIGQTENIGMPIDTLSPIDKGGKTGDRVTLRIGNPEIHEITVPGSIFKSFGKMNNICKGIVSFYFEPDLPIRIVTSIGNYGSLTIHLRGNNAKQV